MDVGARLLHALCVEGDSYGLYRAKVSNDYFAGDELAVYEWVRDYSLKHGKLPQPETLNEFFPGLPKAPEPSGFYLEQVEKRYKHRTLNKGLVECSDLMKDKLYGDVVKRMAKALGDVYMVDVRQQMAEFTEDAWELVKEAYTKAQIPGNGIKFGWEYLDDMTAGLFPGDVVSYVGRPACLSGETLIVVARKGPSGSSRIYRLKDLHDRFHGGPIVTGNGRIRHWNLDLATRVQSLMGEHTGLNQLNDVVYSGKKTTYTVTTASGKSIRATLDHKFRTAAGFVELRDLKPGDKVVCKAPFRERREKDSYRKSPELTTKLPYSPYRTKLVEKRYEYNRVSLHRLAFDAALNGLTPEVFIQKLKTEPDHGLKFSDPKMHVHHKDGDHSNNAPSNLVLLSNEEHQKLHASQERMNVRCGMNDVHEEAIVSIECFGEEDTYDLCCQWPHNNFVANGFVVHNSGKTYLQLYSAHQMWWAQKKNVMFFSMEMPILALVQRIAAIHTGINVTDIKQGTLPKFPVNMEVKLAQKMLAIKDHASKMWIFDGNLAATPEDIYGIASQLKPDVVFIDGAYLLRSTNPKLDRYVRVAENVEAIKNLTGRQKIPTICTYQFKRDTAKKGKKAASSEVPQLEDIAYSDAIGQTSSVVLGLFQDETVETLKTRSIAILKGREGETGQFQVNWNFVGGMDFSQYKEVGVEELGEAPSLEYL